MKLSRVRFPIRLKITIPYIFLAVVISIGIGIISTRVILENVDERFTNQLYEVGKLAADGMVTEESRLLGTLRLLVNTTGVPEAITSNDPKTLRDLLLGIVVSNREEDVEILDAQGNLVLSMHHVPGGRIEEYTFSQGGGASIRDWGIVQKVLKAQADQSGDKYSDRIATEWGNYFFVSGPVLDNAGKLSGVILVGRSLESLAGYLRAITTAQVTIYDTKGQPLASTFLKPLAFPPLLAADILAAQDTSSYRRNPDPRDLTQNDLSYSEIAGPWEGRAKVDMGVLGTALIKNVLVTTSLPTRQMIILLIVVVVFFIVLFGINLASQITQPLLTLVRASNVVSEGNLSVQVQPTTSDEIADLTRSFNTMVASLQQTKTDLLNTYDDTLIGWSKALELRDKETQGHTERVVELTWEFASSLGFDDASLVNIRRGAILHDIGKMGIPDQILLKPGKLTPEEWQTMRQHPQFAEDMLKHIDFLIPALDIPYCHHEKWDGSGYPRGLKGEEIPLFARIFSIVDAWDAMTSERIYHRGVSDSEAISIIQQGVGTQFDPDLMEKFVRFLDQKNLVQ